MQGLWIAVPGRGTVSPPARSSDVTHSSKPNCQRATSCSRFPSGGEHGRNRPISSAIYIPGVQRKKSAHFFHTHPSPEMCQNSFKLLNTIHASPCRLSPLRWQLSRLEFCTMERSQAVFPSLTQGWYLSAQWAEGNAVLSQHLLTPASDCSGCMLTGRGVR